MELYNVRTTFAVREFTDNPLPDPVLYRIIDNARFARSGGRRKSLEPDRAEQRGCCDHRGHGGTR